MEAVEIPQSTLPVEQKSTDWVKIILAAVLGFVLLAGSAYAGYYYGTQQVQSVEKPTPAVSQPQPKADRPLDETSEPTAPPVTGPTAGWETYTNNKCGYEVKYPSGWELSPEPEDGIYGAAVIFPYEISSGVKPLTDWLKVQIGCAERGADVNPRDTIDQLNERDAGYGISKIEQLEQININGNLAFKQVNIPPVGNSVLEYYIFPVGDKYYALGFTPAGTKLETTIDQILSTFKFLD